MISVCYYMYKAPNTTIIGLNVNKTIHVFGRDNETESLTQIFINPSVRIIQVTGLPGIGKTYVVKNTVSKLSSMPDCDLCIIYIDCYEMEGACYDEKTLFKTIVNRHDGSILDTYPCLGYTVNILRFIKSSSDILFTRWIENLTKNTVLIMDNVNDTMTPVTHIINTVKKHGTSIKIVMVSQSKIAIPHDEESEQHHLRITTLQTKYCKDWIKTRYKHMFNASSSKRLCKALDSYPLAVKLAASYLVEENSLDVTTLIDMLTSSNDQRYNSYEQHIEDHFKDSEPFKLKLLKILREIINSLNSDVRKCALRLSEDVSFTETEAEAYYKNHKGPRFDQICIRDLYRYSLVHKYSQKYMFIPFIKDFLHFYKPVIQEENDPESYKQFWTNYYRHYMEKLQHRLLQNDLDLAIKLGSDMRLVNSLLPLIEGFPLITLFTTALEVVSKHINCWNSNNTSWPIVYAPKLLFACGRLTKAVHCPMMHTSTVLTNDSIQNTSDSEALQRCQVELSSCENHIFRFITFDTTFVNSDYVRSLIEAHGYINMLLMSTMRDKVPWKLSLRDLAVFLTSLHSHSYTDTNTSAIVTGLKYYVMKDSFESDHFLTDALNSLSDDSGCQTVLKLILIGAIYSETECSAKTCEAFKQHFQMINLTSLKLNCYLGVMNDIILPFLNETQKQFNMVSIVDMLKLRFNKLLNKEKKHCPKEGRASFDCFPLNRFRGIQASRMIRTQKVNMSSVSSSEWLCLALRDVTTKCNDRWPSLTTQYDTDYKQIYSEYLVSLRLFLDDEKFEGWKKKFQSMIDLNAYPYFE